MKDKVLDLLVEQEGEFVSGEEMSRLLGISRAGIWKHIARLREEGFKIESQTRLGHKIEKNYGPLNKFELGKNLGTSRIGREIVAFKEVLSTNDTAKELARAGAQDGTVVIADLQTGGKGRRGRVWTSPRGGIWMSIILRPGMELKNVASYTLLAGVAVASAINKVTGLNAGIKWPNDILLGGKKIVGILAEVSGEWQTVDFLVVGIGINANLQVKDLPVEVEATSLALELGKSVNVVEIIQAVLQEMERFEQILIEDSLSRVLAEWRSFAVCLNRPVLVKEISREWNAVSVDITDDGALIVRAESGELISLYSGEVSIRTADGDLCF